MNWADCVRNIEKHVLPRLVLLLETRQDLTPREIAELKSNVFLYDLIVTKFRAVKRGGKA
jgi:hypothetical protein